MHRLTVLQPALGTGPIGSIQLVRSNNTCAILSGTLMDTWEALPPDVCVTFVTNVVMVRLVR